jgi:hypothetical protein
LNRTGSWNHLSYGGEAESEAEKVEKVEK